MQDLYVNLLISDVQTWAETKRDALCLVNTIFLVLVGPCSPAIKFTPYGAYPMDFGVLLLEHHYITRYWYMLSMMIIR